MFLINSRLGLFTAAPSRSCRKAITIPGHPFSRSYGVILPSSLTRILSNTLGYSPRLPVSVCGTVRNYVKTLRSYFLAVCITELSELGSSSPASETCSTDLPMLLPTLVQRDVQHPSSEHHCVTPSLVITSSGILTGFPSATQARLTRLRGRLTLRRLSLLRKP